MAIASLYAFLFMLGTCGNAATLAVVFHVRSVDPRARQNATLTYICVLSIIDFISMLPLPMTITDQILGFWMFGTTICKLFRLFEHSGKIFSTLILSSTKCYFNLHFIIDFISMLPLPMTITDQILGFWMFGTTICKLFRLFEHSGKIFSTLILVCFSIDRYCGVCHPLKILGFWMFGTTICKLFRLFEHSGKIFSTLILVCFSIDRYCGVCHPLKRFTEKKHPVELRKTRTAYFMLTFMFCITCIMLAPIIIFAQSKEIILHESYNREKNEITRLHLFKCADNLDNKLFILFSLTCFIFVSFFFF
ncbi:unnamed protein product [Brugia pahangi]|uniref:G_PROTEIN_RECEP_F1_2 domain-containing protein n=1 Tax=Brugia pahangi TaxID=6280 RepID=A0A0N4U079_BRUPA|nr:unnamed protein product [Brugia pahangi]